MKKKKSLIKLKHEFDHIFSRFIRERDRGICFTCGIKRNPSEMQNGHYISRVHMNTRYDEQNCHTQCCACNVFKNGNMPIYTIRLMELYGEGIIKELYQKSQEIRKITRADYEALIEEYKSKLSHL